MKEIINLNMRKEQIGFYQRKEVLVNNICPVFLPVSIIEDGDTVMGYTNTRGYTSISHLRDIDIELCFHIFKEIVNNMRYAKEFLFFPGEYVLSNETIYYKLYDGTIRFAYSPLRPETGERKQLLYVLSQLEKICDEKAKTYVERLYHRIAIANINNSGLIKFMSELKTEYDIISEK